MARQASVIPTVYTETQTQEQLREEIQAKGWWVSVPLTTFPVHWLYAGEQRLDGRYYANEVFVARRMVEDSGFEAKLLGELAEELCYPGRFKRVYAKTEADGTPFLKPTEMLHFRPSSEKFLAHTVKALESCRVSPGWLLVTRSGTVGRCTIATNRLARFVISDDVIRVQAKQVPEGYLHAYLCSWIGQALVAKDQYGSAIKHLEPHHLASVPVPLLPWAEQEAIHGEIMQAYALRDEANDLLDKAEKQLYRDLALTPFDPDQVHYIPPPPRKESNIPTPPQLKAFTTPASELDERFDASYHVPIAHAAVQQLRDGKYPIAPLASLAGDIYIPPRFRRIYVDKEYGVPFIQGSHLPQMKPQDMQYLSHSMTEGLYRWIIHRNWVLVTCSGTVGRISLTPSGWDGWAATQHILRIIPDKEKGHPGYLATFLATPYGQHQLTAKIYGGVVDELTEADTADVRVPDAPLDVQRAIGEKVVMAYEKKDEANAIEDAAIQRLEYLLEERTKASRDVMEIRQPRLF